MAEIQTFDRGAFIAAVQERAGTHGFNMTDVALGTSGLPEPVTSRLRSLRQVDGFIPNDAKTADALWDVLVRMTRSPECKGPAHGPTLATPSKCGVQLQRGQLSGATVVALMGLLKRTD
jgi:hypothetical protein